MPEVSGDSVASRTTWLGRRTPADLSRYTSMKVKSQKIILMVSLDIEGATNNALYSRSNLWNLILDSLLRTRELGVYVQAFADDVVLMFSGQSASSRGEKPTALARCLLESQK
ncbi:hypothetical protein EVAR_9923_1 [Eumeta japonica]|uniref:Uncharacterized protein n=1 Tax=Eumeta variegata TaxID=151549 RepID=A0A4C1TQU4_EUMVA|nr:hypothetical protein EVAR_9923_1 [Eumeta japonica]